MKTFYLASAAALACALMTPAAVSAADAAKSADISHHGLNPSDFPRWHQVVPNVYAYEDTLTTPDFTFTTNSLIIVTTDGVVLVDGQDHDIDVVTVIRGDYDVFQRLLYSFSSPASLKTMTTLQRPILATDLVDEQKTLKLGSTEIQILNLGRGHTGGDLVVYLPEPKVMFLSELYDRNIFPPMITGYPTEWVATLKKAQAMDVTWFIPGHGFTGGDAGTLRADLEDFTKAVELVVSEGKRLHAAGAACATEKDCPANAQANWGPYANSTAAAGQAPRALARAYAELEGKLPN